MAKLEEDIDRNFAERMNVKLEFLEIKRDEVEDINQT